MISLSRILKWIKIINRTAEIDFGLDLGRLRSNESEWASEWFWIEMAELQIVW